MNNGHVGHNEIEIPMGVHKASRLKRIVYPYSLVNKHRIKFCLKRGF